MIYLKLFFTFFKIGLFTFGGGYAMVPLIQAEVASNGWLSGAELVNFIAVSESTPGPFAINIATFVGEKTGGFFGAVCTTIGVVLPAFITILIIAHFMKKFRDSFAVKGVMKGLKASVVGMIGAAIITIGATVIFPNSFSFNVLTTPAFICSVIIFFIMAVIEFIPKIKIHPILIIVISATLGIGAGYAFNL